MRGAILPILLMTGVLAPAAARGQSPSQLAANVSDSTGDARLLTRWATLLGKHYPSPDLISVAASLDDSVLSIVVRFAPGTFDPYRTLADIALDVDGDSTTGTRGGDWPAGEDYSLRIGATAFHSATELTTFANGVVTARDTIGPFSVLPDGYAVRLSLGANGPQWRRMRLYVTTQVALDEKGSTFVLDVIPGTAGADEPRASGWITLR